MHKTPKQHDEPPQIRRLEGTLSWAELLRRRPPSATTVEALSHLGIENPAFAITSMGEHPGRAQFIDSVSRQFPLAVRSADGVDIHLASLHQKNTEAFRLLVGLRDPYQNLLDAVDDIRASHPRETGMPLLVVPPTLLGAVLDVPVGREGEITLVQRYEVPFLPPVRSEAHLYARARSRSKASSRGPMPLSGDNRPIST